MNRNLFTSFSNPIAGPVISGLGGGSRAPHPPASGATEHRFAAFLGDFIRSGSPGVERAAWKGGSTIPGRPKEETAPAFADESAGDIVPFVLPRTPDGDPAVVIVSPPATGRGEAAETVDSADEGEGVPPAGGVERPVEAAAPKSFLVTPLGDEEPIPATGTPSAAGRTPAATSPARGGAPLGAPIVPATPAETPALSTSITRDASAPTARPEAARIDVSGTVVQTAVIDHAEAPVVSAGTSSPAVGVSQAPIIANSGPTEEGDVAGPIRPGPAIEGAPARMIRPDSKSARPAAGKEFRLPEILRTAPSPSEENTLPHVPILEKAALRPSETPAIPAAQTDGAGDDTARPLPGSRRAIRAAREGASPTEPGGPSAVDPDAAVRPIVEERPIARRVVGMTKSGPFAPTIEGAVVNEKTSAPLGTGADATTAGRDGGTPATTRKETFPTGAKREETDLFSPQGDVPERGRPASTTPRSVRIAPPRRRSAVEDIASPAAREDDLVASDIARRAGVSDRGGGNRASEEVAPRSGERAASPETTIPARVETSAYSVVKGTTTAIATAGASDGTASERDDSAAPDREEKSARRRVVPGRAGHDRMRARSRPGEPRFDRPFEWKRIPASGAGRPKETPAAVATLPPGRGALEELATSGDVAQTPPAATAIAPPPSRTAQTAPAPTLRPAHPAAWAAGENILRAVRGRFTALAHTGGHQAEIRLDPPELGRVILRLAVEGDTVKGIIEVENPAVKAALQSDLPKLAASMADSGLQLDQFDVLLADRNRPDDRRNDTTPRRRAGGGHAGGDPEKASAPRELPVAAGGTVVNYLF